MPIEFAKLSKKFILNLEFWQVHEWMRKNLLLNRENWHFRHGLRKNFEKEFNNWRARTEEVKAALFVLSLTTQIPNYFAFLWKRL